MLNFIMFLLIFLFIILPPLLLEKVQLYQSVPISTPLANVTDSNDANSTNSLPVSTSASPEWYETYRNESLRYRDHVVKNTQSSFKSQFQDFLQGTVCCIVYNTPQFFFCFCVCCSQIFFFMCFVTWSIWNQKYTLCLCTIPKSKVCLVAEVLNVGLWTWIYFFDLLAFEIYSKN